MISPMRRLPAVHFLVALLVVASLVAACGESAPSASAGPASASVTQGRFTLTFTLERATVRARDEIVGHASVALLAPGAATVTGAGTFVGYEFTEVGGKARHVEPVFDLTCAPHQVTSGSPTELPIIKSGAWVDGPDAAWYRDFFADPAVKLPAGDWDITAIAQFYDGRSCAGQHLDMRATVRVHVTD
jgi:hypothetical protein